MLAQRLKIPEAKDISEIRKRSPQWGRQMQVG